MSEVEVVRGWAGGLYIYAISAPEPVIMLSLWEIPDLTNGIPEPPQPPQPPENGDEWEWRSYERQKERWKEEFKEWLKQNLKALEAVIIKLPGQLMVFKAAKLENRMAFWDKDELERLLATIDQL